jgi:hypothetical protein
MTTNYGFETSDEIALDKKGFPLGTYKIMCTVETNTDEGFIADYEIVSGEHKGQTVKAWYNTLHVKQPDEKYDMAAIAKQQLRRIQDATGRPISASAPLKNRVFTVVVVAGKNGYNNISRYLSEDHEDDLPPA